MTNWKKIGKIFDPTEHSLPNGCHEYAQSPQAIVFDDYIRVYFSTRKRDDSGKYLSHISFVDFDKNFNEILKISNNTVIELGELGCFDEHGIFPINVLKDDDKILAYTTGWNRKVSVSNDASIGLAFSYNNGTTFEKHGRGPILTASVDEPFLVADAFVKKFDNTYHMWYIYGTKWIDNLATPERVYKIAYAKSKDGINWTRDSKPIISDVLNENECQALPTVEFYNGKYHMYFCYREAIGFRNEKNKGYRIGYAYSKDLKTWKRNDELSGINLSLSGWDSEMMCYPNIFKDGNKLFMLYNGNNFGKNGFGLAIAEN